MDSGEKEYNMKIQVVNIQGDSKEFLDKDIIVSSFHDIQSLDDFDINVILLNSELIWHSQAATYYSVDCIDDIKSIGVLINNCTSCKNIIVYPQNYTFMYNTQRHIPPSVELKDIIIDLRKRILGQIHPIMSNIGFIYENTSTRINNVDLKSAFTFISSDPVCLHSTSNKPVCVNINNMYLTTLDISNKELLFAYLTQIGLIEMDIEEPEWMHSINMFDDLEQKRKIEDEKTIIREAESKIKEYESILSDNKRWKSILYTSGEELVEVVFEILSDITGADFSAFTDIKKEDFRVEIGEKVLLGEIKGVGHNVRSENVSQLDVHYQGFVEDNLDIDINNISALLIMNHQCRKPLNERKEVHENQIKLAKRNGSLIIETIELLKLYDNYRKEDITREECIRRLTSEIGLFKA